MDDVSTAVPSQRYWRLVACLVGLHIIASVGTLLLADSADLIYTLLTSLAGAFFIAAGALCAKRIRHRTGRHRVSWAAFTISYVACGIGVAAEVLTLASTGQIPRFPSSIDALFLFSYGTAILAMLCSTAVSSSIMHLRCMIDSLIMTGSLLFVSWLTILEPLYDDEHVATSMFAVAGAYMICNVTLLLIAVMALSRGAAPNRNMTKLHLVMFTALGAANTAYIWNFAADDTPGWLPTVGWATAGLLAVLAVTRPPTSLDAVRDQRVSIGFAALPYIPLALAGVAAIWRVLNGNALDPLLLTAGAILVAMVLARQFLVLLDNASLTSKLECTLKELENSETDLRFQALHDPLTELANRRLLDRRFEEEHRDSGLMGAILLLDLDDFKIVNDSMGHDAGDALLVGIADRLRQFTRPPDLVSRLGGDEFAILLAGAHLDDAINVGHRLETALAEPFWIQNKRVFITASIGIALGDGTASCEEILRRADIAMYQRKRDGKGGTAVFDASM